MSTHKMTRWGIGPTFGILTCLYSLAIYDINRLWPWTFSFSYQNEIGIALMVIGFIIFIYPAVTIDKYFNEGKLRTTGLYSVCRHPIYASWVLIIIPGIIIYWGAILGLTIPFYAYLAVRSFINKEENYLFNKFGIEYLSYKNKVNAIFPKIFISWR